MRTRFSPGLLIFVTMLCGANAQAQQQQLQQQQQIRRSAIESYKDTLEVYKTCLQDHWPLSPHCIRFYGYSGCIGPAETEYFAPLADCLNTKHHPTTPEQLQSIVRSLAPSGVMYPVDEEMLANALWVGHLWVPSTPGPCQAQQQTQQQQQDYGHGRPTK
jgi:hypothetical protein